MDKKEIAKLIGERITTARNSKDISQKELAKKLGIGQTRLSNWEVGETPAPVEFIPDLSKMLGVSADYLLGLSQDENGDIILDIKKESIIAKVKKSNREELETISKILDIVSPESVKKEIISGDVS